MLTEARESRKSFSRAVAITVLVCGTFGIGVSEFVVMRLLPQITADLIPEQFRTDTDAAVASTGLVVSFYALGVVVGMIVTPLVLRRLPLRSTIMV